MQVQAICNALLSTCVSNSFSPTSPAEFWALGSVCKADITHPMRPEQSRDARAGMFAPFRALMTGGSAR